MCFFPLTAFRNLNNDNIRICFRQFEKKKNYSGMYYYIPFTYKNGKRVNYELDYRLVESNYEASVRIFRNSLNDDYETFELPCGKCLKCRARHMNEIGARVVHELSSSKGKGLFLTLTYKSKHLNKIPVRKYRKLFRYLRVNDPNLYNFLCDPANSSSLSGYLSTIEYVDYQLFMKRLRKYLSTKYKKAGKPVPKIKYIVCSEYGGTIGRPHFHALIFGIDSDDFGDFSLYPSKKKEHPLYSSATLDSIWSKGLVVSGSVNFKTARYVMGYVSKKGSAKECNENFKRYGKKPQRVVFSQGIGKAFFMSEYLRYMRSIKTGDATNTIFDKCYVSVKTGSQTESRISKISVPRYYVKLLKKQFDRFNDLNFRIRIKESVGKSYSRVLSYLFRIDLFFEKRINYAVSKVTIAKDRYDSFMNYKARFFTFSRS